MSTFKEVVKELNPSAWVKRTIIAASIMYAANPSKYKIFTDLPAEELITVVSWTIVSGVSFFFFLAFVISTWRKAKKHAPQTVKTISYLWYGLVFSFVLFLLGSLYLLS